MDTSSIIRVAAFADGVLGGNSAGVHVTDGFPGEDEMQAMAARIGCSETVFAKQYRGGWRARYFAPESEVPFCGHAAIALGAVLAMHYGKGTYSLHLHNAQITVEG